MISLFFFWKKGECILSIAATTFALPGWANPHVFLKQRRHEQGKVVLVAWGQRTVAWTVHRGTGRNFCPGVEKVATIELCCNNVFPDRNLLVLRTLLDQVFIVFVVQMVLQVYKTIPKPYVSK